MRTVSYSSSVRFHQARGTNENTTSRQEFDPKSITATWRVRARLRAVARVDRQLTSPQ